MKSEEIKITIYNNKGEAVRESTAQTFDLRMGSIRKVMELLKVVLSVWDELTGILGECFPDITAEEWDGVKVKEIMPVIVQIMKFAFSEMLTIPADKKNA